LSAGAAEARNRVREYGLELVRQNSRDFGPTLAAEVLRERHEVDVSRETLRTWMVDADLWLSRKQRRTFRQPRLRRESYGPSGKLPCGNATDPGCREVSMFAAVAGRASNPVADAARPAKRRRVKG